MFDSFIYLHSVRLKCNLYVLFIFASVSMTLQFLLNVKVHPEIFFCHLVHNDCLLYSSRNKLLVIGFLTLDVSIDTTHVPKSLKLFDKY